MSTTTSATSATSSAATKSLTAAEDSSKAFRNADFLKIMLAEVTSQSPFDPQDTGKLVENMQKLQELANTTYQKFRADIQWGQDLMGKQVSVQQMPISPAEKEALVNKGLAPDVGYQQVSGKVESFRVVDQAVYVTVGGKDYPIDNLKQIVPQQTSTDLAGVADRLIGKQVVFHRDAITDTGNGKVTSVALDNKGGLLIEVGGESIPYENLIQIGI